MHADVRIVGRAFKAHKEQGNSWHGGNDSYLVHGNRSVPQEFWTDRRLEIVVSGPEDSVRIVVPQPYVLIGSHPDCDVVLDDDRLPDRCYVALVARRGLVGTSLIRRSVARFQPIDGDRGIRAGRYRIRFENVDDQSNADAARGDTSSRTQQFDFQQLRWKASGRKMFADLSDGRPLLLGRHRPSRVRIDDPAVSTIHGYVYRHADRLWVVDLGSANGTHVSGERVRCRALKTGESFVVGRTELTYRPTDDLGLARSEILRLRAELSLLKERRSEQDKLIDQLTSQSIQADGLRQQLDRQQTEHDCVIRQCHQLLAAQYRQLDDACLDHAQVVAMGKRQLELERQAIDDERRSNCEAREQTDEQQRRIDVERKSLDEHRQELDEQQKSSDIELNRLRQQMGHERQVIEEARTQAEHIIETARQQMQAMADRAEQQRTEIGRDKEDIDRQRAEVGRDREDIVRQKAEIESQEADVERQRADMERRNQIDRERRKELDAHAAALVAERQRFESSRTDQVAELNRAKERLLVQRIRMQREMKNKDESLRKMELQIQQLQRAARRKDEARAPVQPSRSRPRKGPLPPVGDPSVTAAGACPSESQAANDSIELANSLLESADFTQILNQVMTQPDGDDMETRRSVR